MTSELILGVLGGGIELKSQTFSGTTDEYGNFNFGAFSDTGIIIAVKELHNYICLNLITQGGSNFGKFIDSSATSYIQKANTAVSGTIYYLDIE